MRRGGRMGRRQSSEERGMPGGGRLVGRGRGRGKGEPKVRTSGDWGGECKQ